MSDHEDNGGPRINDDNAPSESVNHTAFHYTQLYDENGKELFLETKKMGTSIWLVKVPTFVAEKWNGIDKEGVELGKLRIYTK
jgi:transcription initiation factor TFIIF subunit beta